MPGPARAVSGRWGQRAEHPACPQPPHHPPDEHAHPHDRAAERPYTGPGRSRGGRGSSVTGVGRWAVVNRRSDRNRAHSSR